MERMRSWKYDLEEKVAIKELDKSSFERGSHIPKAVRPIFECENVEYKEKKHILLEYKGEEYNAFIEKEINGKIRMVWREIIPVLKNKFKEKIKNIETDDIDLRNLEMKFTKINSDEYLIALYDTEIEEVKEFFESVGIDLGQEEEEILGDIKEYLIKGRINQNKFREKLIKKDCKCKICGLEDRRLLVASHSKSWAESDKKEKVDVNNGFLLCPNHDALYDKYLISFDDKGNILISNSINKKEYSLLGINEEINVSISNEEMIYVKYHRKKFFEKEKYNTIKSKEIEKYSVEISNKI